MIVRTYALWAAVRCRPIYRLVCDTYCLQTQTRDGVRTDQIEQNHAVVNGINPSEPEKFTTATFGCAKCPS